MDNDKEIQKLLDKVKTMEKGEKLDLSSGEDLSVAAMNLIAIEEHLFFSFGKTKDDKYIDLLNQIREMRKKLLKELIKDYQGEEWCLTSDTIVYSNPEPKMINKIESGEKVLTSDGEFLPVKNTFVRDYKGELILITPYYGYDLSITPGHPVLCASDTRRKQNDLWRKNFVDPHVVWKKAGELTESDFLLFPRLKKIEDLKEIEIEYNWTNSGCFKPTMFTQKKKIKVNDKLMELIGLYISEGSISEGTYFYKGHRKTRGALYFSFGKQEVDLIKRTKNLFGEIFHTELKVSETKSTIDLVCHQRLIIKFFKQFGKGSTDKSLPFWLLKLPNEKLFPLFIGLVRGDGCEAKYKITYFTSSQKLAYQLRLLLFKLGIIHSLKKRKNSGGSINDRRIICKSQGYEISVSGDSARFLRDQTGLVYDVKRTSGNFGYILEDYVMIPIRSLKKIQYSGKVYNLEVEGQTYTTFTGIVHNCISKHLLAGCMRLMEVGTKSLSKGEKKEAKEFFQMAYSLYELFWGLNLKLLKTSDLEKTAKKEIESDSTHGFMSKLGEVIKKAIDCCRE